MKLAVRGVPFGQGKGPQICHNQCIHSCIIQQFQVGRKLIHLFIPGHGVDSDMTLHTTVMGIANRQWQFLRGKIPREGTHAKAGTGEIH